MSHIHDIHLLPRENYVQPTVSIRDLRKYFADDHHFNNIYEPRYTIDQQGRKVPNPDDNSSRFGRVQVYVMRDQIVHDRNHYEADREREKTPFVQGIEEHHGHHETVQVYGALKPCPFPIRPLTQPHNSKWNEHYSILPRYNHPIPKGLPERIALKTVTLHHEDAEKIVEDFKEEHLEYFFHRREFLTVLHLKQQGNQFTLFFEYPPTLEDEIIRRRQGTPNPFQEELLWKLMLNLCSAASKVPNTQRLNDIRPSRCHYSNYNVGVVPSNIFPERDDRILQAKFQAGQEPIFYSNEIRNEYLNSSKNLRESQSFRSGFENETFQIGMTVLCAGLLKTEREVGVCDNKQFNEQRLGQLLKDFGDLYGSQQRLLQFTLQEIFLIRSTRRYTPNQVLAEIFPGQQEQNVLWLETVNPISLHLHPDQRYEHFRDHLLRYFKSNPDFQQKLFGFSQAYQSVPRERLPQEMWARYPAHFYFIQREAEYQRQRQALLSRPGARLLEGRELEDFHHRQTMGGSQIHEHVTHSSHYNPIRNSHISNSQYSNQGSQIIRQSQQQRNY